MQISKGSIAYEKGKELLNERAIKRRLKVLPENNLIDYADLPVDGNYLNEINKTGIDIIAKSPSSVSITTGLFLIEPSPRMATCGRVSKKDILNYLSSRTSVTIETPKSEVKTEIPKPVIQQKIEIKPETQERKIQMPQQKIDYNEEGLSVMEFDNIRQKMAEHMIFSTRVSPHVQAIAECDLTNVDKVRTAMGEEFLLKEGFKLSYMPFICEAVIKALKDFPLINSIIDDSAVPYKAITRNSINLGIAVAMDNGGLIVH